MSVNDYKAGDLVEYMDTFDLKLYVGVIISEGTHVHPKSFCIFTENNSIIEMGVNRLRLINESR